MEETYVPRREFRRQTTDNVPKKHPTRRSSGPRQKKETTLRLADIILMQGIVCTLLFAILVCIRVINTDLTIEIREKLNAALSEQLTVEDAVSLIDEGKTKLTTLQQTVKTTFGFQNEIVPETINNETESINEQNETNQIDITESVSNETEPSVVTEVPIQEVTQEYETEQTDEAIVSDETLQQLKDEFNGAATEKKQEPLREITPPSEGI